MDDDDVPDFQKMMGMFMNGMSLPDDSADFVKNQKRSISAIARYLKMHERSIDSFKESVYSLYEPNGPIRESGNYENFNACNFFHRIGSELDEFVTNSIAKISSMRHFNDRTADEDFDFDQSVGGRMALASSIKQTEVISKMSIDILANTMLSFDDFTERLYKKSVEQYRYLQKRFLNVGETGTVRYRNPFDDDEEEGYDLESIKKIRMPIIDDNVMLTDLLLDIADNIPKYYTIKSAGKADTKEKKHLDRFSVDRMARIMMEIGNREYLSYIDEPKRFLDSLCERINQFYDLVSPLEVHIRNIIEEQKRSPLSVIEMHGKKLNSPMVDPSAISRRIQGIDYKGIKPQEEDMKPRNPTEKRVFQAKKELLMHIYSSLRELSHLEGDGRYDAAIAAVEKAAALKEKVNLAGDNFWKRKIEKDTKKDNEFYVGQTAELGQITFVREAAPEIKMSDIVGKSFDVVKKHMEDLMATYGKYPHLFLATSPRRKIKSNIICIGAYGCGKSELGRAIASQGGSITASISSVDALTCMFGEYEKNVKRIWEGVSQIRMESGSHKLAHLLLDEFDAWFSNTEGHWVDTTKRQAQKALQQCLDGVVDYEGVITWGFTNEPQLIPAAVYRRFKHVEVVGQLDREERITLMKKLLTRGLPLSHGFRKEDYGRWSDLLDGATGEIIGKVCDSVHEDFITSYCNSYPKDARKLNSYIRKVRASDKDMDYNHIKREIGTRMSVSPIMIEEKLSERLRDPITKELIDGAKETYKNASKVLSDLYGRRKRTIGFNGSSARVEPGRNGSSQVPECSTKCG